MSYIIRLDQIPIGVLRRSSDHVRHKYNIQMGSFIGPYFQKEFAVEICRLEKPHTFQVKFASEAAYLLFLLRWS
jgi:hypothetical protein